jgi:hypothetical protein
MEHGRILRANPGFELLVLGPAGITYWISPIVGWRFYTNGAGPFPVTLGSLMERRDGPRAVRYSDGRVLDMKSKCTFKDIPAWLAHHERRIESEVNQAVETGQGFTFKAKTAA